MHVFEGIGIVILFVVFVLHVDEDSLSHDVLNSLEFLKPVENSKEASAVTDVEAMPGTPASAVADIYKHKKFLWKEERVKKLPWNVDAHQIEVIL